MLWYVGGARWILQRLLPASHQGERSPSCLQAWKVTRGSCTKSSAAEMEKGLRNQDTEKSSPGPATIQLHDPRELASGPRVSVS